MALRGAPHSPCLEHHKSSPPAPLALTLPPADSHWAFNRYAAAGCTGNVSS